MLRVVSSPEVLMMDVNHIHKIPSQQHLDGCLVESLETDLAKLKPRTDHHCTCQAFALRKIQTFVLLLLSFAVHLDLH